MHGADVAEDRDATPQSRGLLAVAEGFHLLDLGDHRQLELSLPVYDALYAWCKHEVAAGGVSLVRSRVHPAAAGREAGLRPRRRLPARTAAVRRAHRRRPRRCDRLRAAHVSALAAGPARRRRRARRRGARSAVHERPRLPRGSASSAARTRSCSAGSRSGRTRTGSPTTARRRRLYSFNLGEPLGENCTASVVDVDSHGGRSRSCRCRAGRAGRSTTRSATASTRTSASRPRSSSSTASAATIEQRVRGAERGPHGLWLDRGRLFCAADGGALVVLDRDSGEVLASLPLPGVPDVVMHDPELARASTSRSASPGVRLQLRQRTARARWRRSRPSRARTRLGWDPVGRCLYVFCPESGGAARLRGTRLSPDARRIVAAQARRARRLRARLGADRRHARRPRPLRRGGRRSCSPRCSPAPRSSRS